MPFFNPTLNRTVWWRIYKPQDNPLKGKKEAYKVQFVLLRLYKNGEFLRCPATFRVIAEEK
jgi:hypothetical protein